MRKFSYFTLALCCTGLISSGASAQFVIQSDNTGPASLSDLLVDNPVDFSDARFLAFMLDEYPDLGMLLLEEIESVRDETDAAITGLLSPIHDNVVASLLVDLSVVRTASDELLLVVSQLFPDQGEVDDLVAERAYAPIQVDQLNPTIAAIEAMQATLDALLQDVSAGITDQTDTAGLTAFLDDLERVVDMLDSLRTIVRQLGEAYGEWQAD